MMRGAADTPLRANTAPAIAALIGEAEQLERQLRRDEARRRYEAALHLGPHPDPRSAALLLRRVARTYVDEAQFEVALDCLEAALACAEASGDAAGAAQAVNLMAIVRQGMGRLDEAVALYERARDAALHCGEESLVAMVDQNLGTIAAIRGDVGRAIAHYRSSLSAHRRRGLDANSARLLNNLGLLYATLRRWEAAVSAYDQALAIFASAADVSGQLGITVNKAALCIARQQWEQARELCETVLALASDHPSAEWIGEAHKHLGVVHRELGRAKTAEEHFELAQRLAQARHDLLLSAETAREHAELCWREGRHRDTLWQLNAASRAFSHLRARSELADIERRNAELERRFLEIVRKWGESIESKDRYTQGHCERVADIACALARVAGVEEPAMFWLRVGALLHDVGKLVVPSEILNKVGGLSPQEWRLMRQHPIAGVELLHGIDFPWDVRPMIRSHHERWDGGGYPDALTGEAIPVSARILCLADVYDALTTARSYRGPLSHERAVEIMRSEGGRMFDPALLARFLAEVAPRLRSADPAAANAA
jgi:putative nucleotidyltransferase with HDIG domain